MKIVIDIPEELYKKISLNNPPYGEDFPLYYAVRNCIKLPKGHGRLIDADKTLATAWTNFYAHEDEWQKKDPDYLLLGRFYDQKGFECCQQTIVNAPTIIKADKEEYEICR